MNIEAPAGVSEVLDPSTHGTNTPTRGPRGFTLVELLVVIGIIALLISILLPSLSKARRAANRLKCTANMRSMMQGLQLYFYDNKNHQPLFATYYDRQGSVAQEFLYFVAIAKYVDIGGVSDQPIQPGPGGRLWAYSQSLIDGSARTRSVMFCPEQAWSWSGPNPVPASFPNNPWFMFTSYGTCYKRWDWQAAPDTSVNPPTSAQGYTPTSSDFLKNISKYLGTSLSTSPRSSNVAVFGHMAGGGEIAPYATYQMIMCAAGGWADLSYQREPSHDGLLPFAFLDGHVDTISWTQIQDANKYGPGGDTPIWSRLFW